MAAPTPFSFSTGPTSMPDIGALSYNGCSFSPLFVSSIHGNAIKDAAGRTIKYMEYVIEVDGYVTLPAGLPSISPLMVTLRTLLTAQGGSLVYQGRGMDLIVNPVGAVGAAPGLTTTADVAWGPVPELLEFQPLGGGNSAKVRWSVKVRIPEPSTAKKSGLAATPLLQFNYDTTVTFDEAGFSTLAVSGTLEIPLTRPTQTTRTLATTVDDYRVMLDTNVFAGIDLERFTVKRRTFKVSRDRRTLEWDLAAEEKPYMDLPPDCTVARGKYSVRPAKAGMGLCTWLCTLSATYTVRPDKPRRIAWFAFLALMRMRMISSVLGSIPALTDGGASPARGALTGIGLISDAIVDAPTFGAASAISAWAGSFMSPRRKPADSRRAWLMDFSVDEGLYLDSRTVSFSATWRLITSFSHILLASGIWRKLKEEDPRGENLWAFSMSVGGGAPTGSAQGTVMGFRSWLTNNLNPDVIVDFGGP